MAGRDDILDPDDESEADMILRIEAEERARLEAELGPEDEAQPMQPTQGRPTSDGGGARAGQCDAGGLEPVDGRGEVRSSKRHECRHVKPVTWKSLVRCERPGLVGGWLFGVLLDRHDRYRHRDRCRHTATSIPVYGFTSAQSMAVFKPLIHAFCCRCRLPLSTMADAAVW